MPHATASGFQTRPSASFSEPPRRSLTDIAARPASRAPRCTGGSPTATNCSPPCRIVPREPDTETHDGSIPPGRLGRERPVTLDAIHVFDVVPPAALPEQLVAEAQRIAQVPVALYVLDIDGIASAAHGRAAPARRSARGAAGGRARAGRGRSLRASRAPPHLPGAEVYALWLRGRANGVMIAFGRPAEPLSELARQAAAAITLADRYTDVFALAQRRKQPKGRRGDPAKPSASAHHADHRRRGCRTFYPATRSPAIGST